MTKNGRLHDRVALVTGAARGIGLGAARILAQEGARVMLCDVDEDALQDATDDLRKEGLQVQSIAADVSEEASIEGAVTAATTAWRRLDILVSNAAIGDESRIETLTAEHWHRVMNINLDSVLYGAKVAKPHLERSPCASIINIASIQGLRGQANSMAYATAKGAVVNLTRCMAVDFGPLGIRVNAVAPGYIDTRMALMHGNVHEHQTEWFQDVFIKHGRLPLRRPGGVDDVSGPILFLASDDSRYVTGHVLVVDGGLTCTY
jgi:NAD(P)-dependent dehydrogenase (short-subunit alcohol dehydrogenase family)